MFVATGYGGLGVKSAGVLRGSREEGVRCTKWAFKCTNFWCPGDIDRICLGSSEKCDLWIGIFMATTEPQGRFLRCGGGFLEGASNLKNLVS